jgi:hypothetical protein
LSHTCQFKQICTSFPHQVTNLTLHKKPVNPFQWVDFNLF